MNGIIDTPRRRHRSQSENWHGPPVEPISLGDMPMKTAITLFVASVLMASAFTANAATIQNRDQSEYQLRIVEDGQERQVALLPSAAASDLCKSKCDLYIGTDPVPYDLISADKLSIEGGQLLYDDDGKDSNTTAKQ